MLTKEKIAAALENRFIKTIENASKKTLDELVKEGLKLPAQTVWLSYAEAVLEVV